MVKRSTNLLHSHRYPRDSIIFHYATLDPSKSFNYYEISDNQYKYEFMSLNTRDSIFEILKILLNKTRRLWQMRGRGILLITNCSLLELLPYNKWILPRDVHREVLSHTPSHSYRECPPLGLPSAMAQGVKRAGLFVFATTRYYNIILF